MDVFDFIRLLPFVVLLLAGMQSIIMFKRLIRNKHAYSFKCYDYIST